MDVKIINPFVEALLDVTESMAQLTGQVGKPELKTTLTAPGIVSGFIRLNGRKANGTLAVSFSEPSLLMIFERMLGESLPELDDSAYDLAGELTNMVCGGAKRRLSDSGYEFDLTQPDILKGLGHRLEHGKGPIISLPIQFGLGNIYIEVSLKH